MSAKYKGFHVLLEKDIHQEDFEEIRQAVQMIKGVQSVEPIDATSEDWMARDRVRSELGAKLVHILYSDANKKG
jgi:hypothetical protein